MAEGHERFETGRLEMFSDGVFAIIITLLVLDLRVPHAPEGVTLAARVAAMWPNFIAFIVSFMLVGVVWMNHHAMFRHIREADHTLNLLNLLLLLCVAVIPFVAAVSADSARGTFEERRTAALLYGAALVIGGVFFNLIWRSEELV